MGRTSSSAMAERPRDACFTSIREMVKIMFLRNPLEDFMGNLKALSLGRWNAYMQSPITNK